MTSEELLAAAYQANPEFIEKTANALFVLEKWEPEFAAELAADINTITTITMEKSAMDWKAVGNTAMGMGGKAALGLGGAIGIGLAGAVAGDLYDAAKRGLTKGSNLKRILDSNPELRRGDKKTLMNSFNTLHRYAPEFTADPMLGGQLLNRMVELPQDQVNLVKDLLTSRKTLVEAKKNQFSMGKPDFASKASLADRMQEAMEEADISHAVKKKYP